MVPSSILFELLWIALYTLYVIVCVCVCVYDSSLWLSIWQTNIRLFTHILQPLLCSLYIFLLLLSLSLSINHILSMSPIVGIRRRLPCLLNCLLWPPFFPSLIHPVSCSCPMFHVNYHFHLLSPSHPLFQVCG